MKLITDIGGSECLSVAFEDDDPLVEHFQTSNTKAIKDILRPLAVVLAMTANYENSVGFINQQLEQVILNKFKTCETEEIKRGIW
jgi:hypothetical protein